MKLKVIDISDTPKNCTHRAILNRDDGYQEWVRDTQDCVFMLWSNSHGHRGDMIYDSVLKKRVEVESPYEEILDDDGYGTDEYKLKDGIIAFPVDVYEHSGRAWALHGEGGPCFSCPWDTARGAFVLYVDKERWDKLCGNCEWKFVDGKPTDELLDAARKIARAEIKEMNLCESGCYYGYEEEFLVNERQKVVATDWDGSVRDESERCVERWIDGDSCYGYLTDNPARDVDFPVGCPVFTTDQYLVGDTFEQECFALSDDMTGKFVKFDGDGFKLVDDPKFATLWGYRNFPETNRKAYENDLKKALTIVDVTERVWSNWPECKA